MRGCTLARSQPSSRWMPISRKLRLFTGEQGQNPIKSSSHIGIFRFGIYWSLRLGDLVYIYIHVSNSNFLIFEIWYIEIIWNPWSARLGKKEKWMLGRQGLASSFSLNETFIWFDKWFWIQGFLQKVNNIFSYKIPQPARNSSEFFSFKRWDNQSLRFRFHQVAESFSAHMDLLRWTKRKEGFFATNWDVRCMSDDVF